MASARKLLIPVALVLFALSFYCFYRFDRHHARYVTTTHGAIGGHSMLEVILFFWVAIAGAACLVASFTPRSSLPAYSSPRACSNANASASSLPSLQAGPVSRSPTGRSQTNPAGTLIDG
jgi:hypothetical protein